VSAAAINHRRSDAGVGQRRRKTHSAQAKGVLFDLVPQVDKILSQADSQGNITCIYNIVDFYLMLTVLLHYLVKFEN